ncbi:MAG: hypothetical protein P8Z37_14390 [Acidobacteriota bacterium]
MRTRIWISAVIMLLLFTTAACQGPEPEPESHTSCDRACLENYVDQYLDAMMENKPGPELFAENCRFTENGVQLPLGEGLWASMVGKGTYKFYVPDTETQQVAFIGTARAEAQNPGGDPRPVAIALRLKIESGLISEAEQLVIRPETNLLNPDSAPAGPSAAERIELMGEQLGNPHPIFTAVIPEEKRPSREKMIEVANYYFSGMQKNDGKGYYPFTDDCDRYENGGRSTNVPLAPGQEMPDPTKETSYSSHWGCKEQFESGLIHFVTRIRDRRFVAVDRERGIVFSFCFFDHAAGQSRHFTTPDGRQVFAGPAEHWTWQVAELFKIENEQIRRIEAVLQRCPYGMNSGWSTYEDGMSDQIQIIE